MGTINPQIPQSGQPNSSEDLKIISGMGTIRDEINGNLDNDNIASGANINGNKLLAASVGTTQLAADAVTKAKILADAVGNAELDLYMATNSDLVTPGAGAATVVNSIASVEPGTYLVIAHMTLGTATVWASHTIGYSGGTVSGTANPDGYTVFATLTVTATTTIQQKLDTGSGTYRVNLVVVGVKA